MKKMNKKGFTLIELLAVIVILGLLMAIAIPSVTKYINQSRKKTLVSTIGNYISALITDVNNGDYQFNDSNLVYAVPIECISIEKGGTKTPWGDWLPALNTTKNDDGTLNITSNDYWAYVLIQYDGISTYTYGFTFRDSKGYGMQPLSTIKINDSGSDIINVSVGENNNTFKRNLSELRPKEYRDANGNIVLLEDRKIIEFIEFDNNDNSNIWNLSGFKINNETNLRVLTGLDSGDGKYSCTLKKNN